MAMYNDIDCLMGKENSDECFSNSLRVRDDARIFQKDIGSCLGPGDEEKVVWNPCL